MGRDVDSRPPLGRRAPCPCLSFPRPPVSTMLLELLCVSLEGWGKAKTWNRLNRCPPCTSWRCVPRDPHPLISCPGLSEGPLGHGGHRRPWHERQDRGQGRASLGCQKGPPSALLISIHPREQLVWLGPRGGAQLSHRPPPHHTQRALSLLLGAGAPPHEWGSQEPGRTALCLVSLWHTPLLSRSCEVRGPDGTHALSWGSSPHARATCRLWRWPTWAPGSHSPAPGPQQRRAQPTLRGPEQGGGAGVVLGPSLPRA